MSSRPLTASLGVPRPVTDAQRHASAVLQRLDGAVMLKYGLTGIGLMRAVLIGGRTIAQAAREGFNGSQRALDWHARFFRACLEVLAVVTGHAAKPRGWRPSVVDRWFMQAIEVAGAANYCASLSPPRSSSTPSTARPLSVST